MADEIRIELIADANGVVKAVEKVVPAAEKAGKKAAKAIEEPIQKTGDAIKNSFIAIGAVIGAAMGGKQFIEAAAVQDAAVQKLNASLRTMGVFSEETSKSLQDFASALQSQSIVGDEVILNQLAVSQAMGATVEQSKKVLTVAADMSSALGMSLDGAVRNLSKSLGGALGELGELAPELKGLTQEQLKNGAALDILAGKYAGFAMSETKTFNGAMTQLQNTLGDAAEKIGEAVVKSPVLIKAINLISDAINNTFGKFPVESLIKDLNGFIYTIADVAQSLTVLIQPIVQIGRAFDLLWSLLKTGLQTIITLWTESFNFLAEKAINSILYIADGIASLIPGVQEKVDAMKEVLTNMIPKEGLQLATEAAGETLDLFVAETGSKFEALLENNSGFAESIRNNVNEFVSALNEMDTTTTATVENMGKTTGTGVAKITNDWSKLVKTEEEFAKQTKMLLFQQAVSTVSNTFASMGAAVANGTNVMQAAFGALLSGFGQALTQMGVGYIAQGLAMTLAYQPGGPALMAQGAAMSALGGFMSAKFGGGAAAAPSAAGGAASGAAGGAAGGGATMATDTLGSTSALDVANAEEPQKIEKQQQVQLVVQGDILDSEETGTRLLNILNEEFDAKGGRIAYA